MADERVTIGSGNVFDDLAFDDPEGELEKARLVREIRTAVADERLSTSAAVDRCGVGSDELSAILDGAVDAIPLERLIACLRALDREVEIVVRARAFGSS